MKSLFFILLIYSAISFAAHGAPELPEEKKCIGPWFTGSLLGSSANVVPQGYYNIEPYTFYTVITGRYNKHWDGISLPDFTKVNFQSLFYVGITDWMDIFIIPQGFWNHTQGVSHLVFGDFAANLDIQITNPEDPRIPSLKIFILEVFPTGKYEKSDPNKFTTDLGGAGTYQTSFGLVTGSQFAFKGCHFLSIALTGLVSIYTDVDVKGINAYGGAPDTHATIHPGMGFLGMFTLQYNFTQHIAFAMDVLGVYEKKITYKGFAGTSPIIPPDPFFLGSPSKISFSLTPSLEYNFSEHFGIIAGAWFSIAGKNADRFISGVLAVNYYAAF